MLEIERRETDLLSVLALLYLIETFVGVWMDEIFTQFNGFGGTWRIKLHFMF